MSARDGAASRGLTIGIVAAVVVAAGVLAFALTGGDTEEAVADVDLTGDSLTPLPDGGAQDPAIGQPAPVANGQDLDGAPITVGEPGDGGQAVLFLAHWCPACQQEVPQVQQALDEGVLPDDVELVAVSTAVDPGRDPYPPQEWLADEGWQVPTLLDDGDNTVFDAYTGGQGAFPFWAFLDRDGRVLARHAGLVPTDVLADVMGQVAAP